MTVFHCTEPICLRTHIYTFIWHRSEIFWTYHLFLCYGRDNILVVNLAVILSCVFSIKTEKNIFSCMNYLIIIQATFQITLLQNTLLEMFTYSSHKVKLNSEYNKNGMKCKSAQTTSISRVVLVSVFFAFVYLKTGSKFELLQQHGTTRSLTSFCLYVHHHTEKEIVIITAWIIRDDWYL